MQVLRIPDASSMPNHTLLVVYRDLWRIIYNMSCFGSSVFRKGMLAAIYNWKSIGILKADNTFFDMGAAPSDCVAFPDAFLDAQSQAMCRLYASRITSYWTGSDTTLVQASAGLATENALHGDACGEIGDLILDCTVQDMLNNESSVPCPADTSMAILASTLEDACQASLVNQRSSDGKFLSGLYTIPLIIFIFVCFDDVYSCLVRYGY